LKDKVYFKYWGKAEKGEDGQSPRYHLLPYHCLDVAAVGHCWWHTSQSLRNQIVRQTGVSEQQAYAWVMFFLCLHDHGKFDIRFQVKAPKVCRNLLFEEAEGLSEFGEKYDHGKAGYMWFVQELSFFCPDMDYERQQDLVGWMQAVAGHHGQLPPHAEEDPPVFFPEEITESDRMARFELVDAAREMFLSPAGAELHNVPTAVPNMLAGFCSICDWVGSNSNPDFFSYEEKHIDLSSYFESRLSIAEKALHQFGLVSGGKNPGGMAHLFPDYKPRGLQTCVQEFPLLTGLTVIEAPTGSGKTEAALAYASRLIAEGLADSIVFALPTQATANAMLKRLEDVADRFFVGGKNVVLAHGKSRLSREFFALKKTGRAATAQGHEEAMVQCSEWLATSRKRVFLGQVGVCTIDQVLLSVLPVRHNFVRGFGIRKSVLIVDEVHAYDSYMYGLLHRVLEQQHQAGGGAILLSATLPAFQRRQLFESWGDPQDSVSSAYPLVSSDSKEVPFIELPDDELPENFSVAVELRQSPLLAVDGNILDEIVNKAEQGAMVAVICNLVADAQAVASELAARTSLPVDLFHSRFRFMDRQKKEQATLETYGKDAVRQGRILVATQVVEQSLDLDFDWMVTQLCPVDLLFQRLGRLHRHQRSRPGGFEASDCTVIVLPEDSLDYDNHGLVYQNHRALWRTQQKLNEAGSIHFPEAYRDWIEEVYALDAWKDEPAEIQESYEAFSMEQEGRRYAALLNASVDATPFQDTDSNISALTRDSEMSLNVIPVIVRNGKRSFLEGEPLDSIEEWQLWEKLNLNTVGVPASWGKHNILPSPEKDGLIYLEMESQEDGWMAERGKYRLTYTTQRGLERGGTMNLLIDDWIPVLKAGEFRHISLKRLLCREEDWQLSLPRDDMELAALQLVICLVQVVFMPDNDKSLWEAWQTPMKEDAYDRGIQPYLEWFDLLHEKYPFMQDASVVPDSRKKNWSSPQKLFVGLPERTSTSPSSNAFFNMTDEILKVSLPEAVIALYQQATNGFSLGGATFSVGLKGSMPITTLVTGSSLRKSVWQNVLCRTFLSENAPQILSADTQEPVWVVSPNSKYSQESSVNIGLLRGLFWQPAKVKFEVDKSLNVMGFFKTPGTCKIKGCWQHPHTPFDLSKLNSTNAKDNPYLSARSDLPLWEQLLSFFYSQSEIAPTEQEGVSHALVVKQFRQVWFDAPLDLAVGGYVKGKSAESLAGRRHEIFSMSSGWDKQTAAIKKLISIGISAFKALNGAVNKFGFIAIERRTVKGKEAKFKAGLKAKSKATFYKNSEPIVHSIMRQVKYQDLGYCKQQFADLAKSVFDQIVRPYEHDPVMLGAIVESRASLQKSLNSI
jgi:CRISPR-associated endonuclease/helicase Cas3